MVDGTEEEVAARLERAVAALPVLVDVTTMIGTHQRRPSAAHGPHEARAVHFRHVESVMIRSGGRPPSNGCQRPRGSANATDHQTSSTEAASRVRMSPLVTRSSMTAISPSNLSVEGSVAAGPQIASPWNAWSLGKTIGGCSKPLSTHCGGSILQP